jgi:hypothetical protein
MEKEIAKLVLISNIRKMEAKIGVHVSSYDSLIEHYNYDELHEKQIGLIEHYNNAIYNMNNLFENEGTIE